MPYPVLQTVMTPEWHITYFSREKCIYLNLIMKEPHTNSNSTAYFLKGLYFVK